MGVSAYFGFGRNEKKPFGRKLISRSKICTKSKKKHIEFQMISSIHEILKGGGKNVYFFNIMYTTYT